ncbi:putative transcription factor [Cinnamomum micranthum f. kanehirae]|uniref:Putative transcription factor n=1 Tax=Cinnamomum micranthum f. kanehirae TaxID=337451 RepID=A0A443PC79_9MAGN|nr:putative transcription factor [Cinnamomum micranthum f. kanehirae]
MPTVWFSLKKSLHCKSDRADVHEPKAQRTHLSAILTKKTSRSGCSRSIANLKDVVIHGSKRHTEKAPTYSPRSIGSSEFLNPITHEVILSNSRCELKITGFDGCNEGDSHGSSILSCHKCGEQFGKWEAAEAHHLSKHAVTELIEGDSSRKIVEIICRTNWLKSDNNFGRIERVLKVHNMQKILARYKWLSQPLLIGDMQCLPNYKTWVLCKNGVEGGIGVFTTSTSGRAFESIELYEESPDVKRALLVCRVIAGRVHRPLENIQELAGQTGFDSLAGKVGLYSNIEELYLLNPRALLPCFVVICKP